MPEGHTLHRLARAWRPLAGRQVRASSPQGRFTDGAATIDGRRLSASDAYGKHLLLNFEEAHLHVHLGLAGAMFEVGRGSRPSRGVRLRLEPDGTETAWHLVAPSRCELLDGAGRHALLARLGPDPLRHDDPAPAFRRIVASRRPIGDLLLDQAVLAGVGNVLRAEALHHCRIHPEREGTSLLMDELRCLWNTLTRLMERATDEGRIITVDVPAGVDVSTLAEADGRHVYKQERCRTCGSAVRAWSLGTRTAYACERCQRTA